MELSNKQKVSVEDLIEYSRDRGINFPKSHLESIRVSLEQGSPTSQLIENVNIIASRYEEKGFAWYVQTDHNPKYPLMRFMDKFGNTKAYIAERVNKETQEHFFVANRISEKGEHLKICSNNSLEAVRSNVTAYYTGAVICEIANEFSKSKNAEVPSANQEQSNCQKTPELSLSK